MMDIRGKQGSALKTTLIVIVAIIVVLVLIVVWSFWYTSTENEIEKVLVVEQDYIKNADAFNIEYGIATPEEIISIASLERAKGGVDGAKPLLNKMKENSTQIKTLVSESKSEFSGDKLQWFEKVDICYDKRLTMIGTYEQVLSNEEKYFTYYEHYTNFNSVYSEFTQLLGSYILYGKNNDKTNAKKTLSEMKVKIALIRDELQKANSAVPLTYLNNLIDWTNKYDEIIDLSLKYYDASGSEQTNLEKQILDKGVAAGKVLNEANTRSGKDFDSWYVPNVINKRDEADKLALSANQACGDAAGLYSSLFPNANVVSE